MKKHNQLINKKNKATRLFAEKRYDRAEKIIKDLIKTNSTDSDLWQMLGTVFMRSGRYPDAERCFCKTIEINASNHEAYYQLGCALLNTARIDDASTNFHLALQIKPDFIEPLIALGNIRASLGKLEEAMMNYKSALQINPNQPVVYSNLGNVLADQGKVDEAISEWRHALTLKPEYTSAYSNLLLALNYSPSYSGQTIFAEHLKWARQPYHPKIEYNHYPQHKDTKRTIRVGYVTPDLREHSVAYFLEPILKNHDPKECRIYCYADIATPDETTRRLSSLVPYYNNTASFTNQKLAEQIYKDKIDILVDIAGHTSGNRLQVFMRKPAPVQVTYLGYPNTTGLDAIDYRITDNFPDPVEESGQLYTERLARLPKGFLCYSPPREAPEVNNPPSKTNGYITFGAFNYIGKTTPDVIKVWAKILAALPESRLIMKNRSLSDTNTCNRYVKLFREFGISDNRLDMIGLTSEKSTHMAVYNRIDICLDTFPYNGTTTTCDALWMGVPVITLAGERHASRVGKVSCLSSVSTG